MLIFQQEINFKGKLQIHVAVNIPSAQNSGAEKSSAERMILFTFCMVFILKELEFLYFLA